MTLLKYWSLLLTFLMPFSRGSYGLLLTVHLRKGSNKVFQGLLDTDYKLIMILEDPRKHCGLPVKVEAYGIQVIAVLTEVQLTVGPRISSCGYFSSSRMHSCCASLFYVNLT